jgi:acetylornithine/N-succinyldiaminopimelate aminotransferase
MQFQDYPVSSLMNIAARPEIVFTHGDGSWLVDHTGKRYLDFVQGWAVNCLGHNPPAVVDALARQSRKLINPSPAFYNEEALAFAKRLTDQSCFQRVFFTNSGAEANEGAIKLARRWGRKLKGGAYEIITFDRAFHGRTLATMSASGKPGWDTLFAPQVPGFPKATLNDLDSVEKLIGPNTVGVMLEPVQGEAGVYPATVEFMQALRKLTRERGLLLIVDEVQTGVGRTGKLFAYEHSGIEPDIMTLGKGIGGGVPLAALLSREDVSVFEYGDQGGTYNGNPLMCAVGSAVLDVVSDPAFLESVRQTGDYLSGRLTDLSTRLGLQGDRGAGLLRALDLGADIGAKVVEIARDDGLLINSPRPATLRFMSALNVSRDEIDRMIDGTERAIAIARK